MSLRQVMVNNESKMRSAPGSPDVEVYGVRLFLRKSGDNPPRQHMVNNNSEGCGAPGAADV